MLSPVKRYIISNNMHKICRMAMFDRVAYTSSNVDPSNKIIGQNLCSKAKKFIQQKTLFQHHLIWISSPAKGPATFGKQCWIVYLFKILFKSKSCLRPWFDFTVFSDVKSNVAFNNAPASRPFLKLCERKERLFRNRVKPQPQLIV